MEAVSLSLNQICTLEKEVELVLVKVLPIVVPAEDTTTVLVAVPLCLNEIPMSRFAELEVVVELTLFPIPTSSALAAGMFVSMFCLILNDTYPLVRAVMELVGENANITCDPLFVVAF